MYVTNCQNSVQQLFQIAYIFLYSNILKVICSKIPKLYKIIQSLVHKLSHFSSPKIFLFTILTLIIANSFPKYHLPLGFITWVCLIILSLILFLFFPIIILGFPYKSPHSFYPNFNLHLSPKRPYK